MSAERQMKVLANCEQGLTLEQKAQARANIDAQGALTEGTGIDISGGVISVDTSVIQEKLTAGSNIVIEGNTISATAEPQLNADWDATSGVQEILHKPDLTVYALKTDLDDYQEKLTAGSNITIQGNVISATAAPQKNADWTATSGVEEILHKPAEKVLVAGSGIAFIDNADSVTITSTGPSIVQKLDYGDASASMVATLLIDSDDVDGYAVVKCDNVNKGNLVVGPYKGLLDSGINGGSGKGSDCRPLYIDGNGQFAICTRTPKRSHTAELYLHHYQDGDHYNVRNVRNGCINHVAVTGHLGDICYIEIEAPTLDGAGEEYDYIVTFDCTNSSGSTKNVVVQNADPEIFTYPLDTASNVVRITQTQVYFDGSTRSQIEVLGERFTVHSY